MTAFTIQNGVRWTLFAVKCPRPGNQISIPLKRRGHLNCDRVRRAVCLKCNIVNCICIAIAPFSSYDLILDCVIFRTLYTTNFSVFLNPLSRLAGHNSCARLLRPQVSCRHAPPHSSSSRYGPCRKWGFRLPAIYCKLIKRGHYDATHATNTKMKPTTVAISPMSPVCTSAPG